MYPVILSTVGNFSTMMSVSGDATGTGKSLAMSTFMKAFRGDSAVTVSSVTYAETYQMLNDGENVNSK